MTIATRTATIVSATIALLSFAPTARAQTYPLGRYELDQHVDAGLTNLSGTVNAIPHALAAILWSVDRHVASWVISLFNAAFNIDVLAPGSPLANAVAASARHLYDGLARPLMATAIILTGLWALWTMLVQRRYGDGAGRLAVSLAYCIAAMALTLAPAQTIGVAAEASHQVGQAALTAALPGGSSNAARSATDGLRTSLIGEPWLLLDFGSSVQCLDGSGNEAEPVGYRASGAVIAPSGGSCLNTHTLARRFLEHDPGSDERNHAFDQLKSGTPLQRASVRIQTGSAGYDRVAIAIGLLLASVGAFILIGGLSLGMIASQLYALLLSACAPVALLAALVPGHGHHVFEVWARQLIGAIFRSAVYCLYLTLATALSLALAQAAPSIGQIGTLTLQAILWWGLVIYGRRLSMRLAETAIAAPAANAASGAATRIVRVVQVPGRARNEAPAQ